MTRLDVSTVAPRMWTRFLAPYYVCNAIALLMYVPIRYHQSSEALQARDNFLKLPLEYEILLLALGSWLFSYRRKPTIDGVVSLFFMYGKVAVLASLYYLDMTLFGWYAVVCLVLFAAVGQPKYEGPAKITELDPGKVEKMVKSSFRSKKNGRSTSWLVFYYADWSDSCVEIEPMLADISLRLVNAVWMTLEGIVGDNFVSWHRNTWNRYASDSLQFGRVDINKWSDLAVENRISVSTSSWQLPTFILFQNGKEVMRLPPIDDNGKVTKTLLDRAGIVAVFKLEELSEGKTAVFKPKNT